MPAFNAMISESIPHEQRGAGYGAYRMITSIPSIFSSLFGGIVMDSLGVMAGVRLFLGLIIVVTIAITLIRAMTLRETLSPALTAEKREKEYLSTGAALKQAPRAIYFMLLAASISSFAMNLVMPYIVIYAVEARGLTKTQWGFISMITGVISTLLAIPGGMLSDRIGRKFSILIGKLMPAASYLFLSLSVDFNQIFLAQAVSALGSAFGLGAYGEQGDLRGKPLSLILLLLECGRVLWV